MTCGFVSNKTSTVPVFISSRIHMLRQEVFMLDGGFSTQLSCNVEDQVDGTPLWTAGFLVSNPDAVVKTHLDFLKAGANILITDTYQASIGGFVTHFGLTEEQSYDLIKTAVKLAKQAESLYIQQASQEDVPKITIAGSVGPYGACLCDGSEYSGTYVENVSSEELLSWHRPRIEALVEAGVDVIAFETIPAQKEAEILVELLKEFPDQKAWLSFSCKDVLHTNHGERLQDAAESCWRLNSSQLVAVGVNCVNPTFISSLVTSINTDRADDPIPLIVYPNSGEIYDAKQGWTGKEDCRPLETYVPEWLNLGVTYIGGCCRTKATDIVKIKSEVKKWQLGRKVEAIS